MLSMYRVQLHSPTEELGSVQTRYIRAVSGPFLQRGQGPCSDAMLLLFQCGTIGLRVRRRAEVAVSNECRCVETSCVAKWSFCVTTACAMVSRHGG